MDLNQLNKHLTLLQQLEEARDLHNNIAIASKSLGSQKLTGMPHGSGVSDRVGMFAVELADIEGRIRYLESKIAKSEEEIKDFLETIPSRKWQVSLALRFRFIHGYAWCEVASIIGGKYKTEESVKQLCYRYLDNQNVT